MSNEPFKRITKVTPEIANNWQKHYVCMEQVNRPLNRTYKEQSRFDDKFNLWRQLIWQSAARIFTRPLAAQYMQSAEIYENGWVFIEREDSIEVGVLIAHNEDHETQLEVTTKIKHLPTGELVGNSFTARLDEQIVMEIPGCQMQMTITEVPMEGGA